MLRLALCAALLISLGSAQFVVVSSSSSRPVFGGGWSASALDDDGAGEPFRTGFLRPSGWPSMFDTMRQMMDEPRGGWIVRQEEQAREQREVNRELSDLVAAARSRWASMLARVQQQQQLLRAQPQLQRPQAASVRFVLQHAVPARAVKAAPAVKAAQAAEAAPAAKSGASSSIPPHKAEQETTLADSSSTGRGSVVITAVAAAAGVLGAAALVAATVRRRRRVQALTAELEYQEDTAYRPLVL